VLVCASHDQVPALLLYWVDRERCLGGELPKQTREAAYDFSLTPYKLHTSFKRCLLPTSVLHLVFSGIYSWME